MEKLTNEFKIEYVKGDTYAFALKFKNITEDLSKAYLTVKENPDDSPLIQKSLGAGIDKIDDRAYKNEKTYKFQLQPADTVNIEPKVQYLYDIQVTIGTVVKTVLHGIFILNSTITGTSSITTQELEVEVDDELETELATVPATNGVEYEQDPVACNKIGDMATLTTTNKDTLVKAINEVEKDINEINNGTKVVPKATDVLSKINGKNISDIFEDNGTTIKNATSSTYSQYASEDIAKGTIEQRLTNLGFKEGVVDNLVATASTNFLKRQGNYIIGQLDFGNNSFYNDTTDGNIVVIGCIPTNFRPKQDNYVFAPFKYAYFDLLGGEYSYGLLKLKISTSGEITIESFSGNSYTLSTSDNTYSKTTSNSLSFNTIYGLKIQFGYEATPIS